MYKVLKVWKVIMLFLLLSGGVAGLYYLTELSKPNSSPDDQAIETAGLLEEVLAMNLHIPWTIAKHHETFYLTQRSGSIIELDLASGEVAQQEVKLTIPVHHEGEGGLLGFVLTPQFDSARQAIAYYNYQQDTQTRNRIVVLEKRGNSWIETSTLLENIPGGTIHNGGRIKIGPDGLLYVTTGDIGQAELAQELNSLAGKILRMNLDGSIPSDNPFAQSYVYSYGHRNPQGLAWDTSGNLYSTEHGAIAHDEINLIQPGQNYGWPVVQGDQEAPGMIKPLYHTGEDTWAPAGMDYHNGKLYLATLRDQRIRSFDLDTHTVAIIHENSGRMRDVYIEDTNLYAVTSNRDGRGNPREGDDRLIRIKLTR